MNTKDPGGRHQWLHGEIARWQTEGLIDQGQAEQIAARYPAVQAADDGWGKVIIAALGAIIFGLGVILIFAYNWQGMHRNAKLATVFAGVILAHGIGWTLNKPGGTQRKLGESFHLLGTMLFGAAIWLVAQIYHIDEHYPNAYFAWSLGALTLAWAMPSIAQGLLAVALVFLWTWFKTFDFQHVVHWGPVLIAFGVLPLAWLQRSRALLAVGLCAFLLVYAFSLARVDDDLIFTALLIWSGVLLGLGRSAQLTEFPLSAPIFTGIGTTVFIPVLFAFTFSDVAGDLLGNAPTTGTAWFYLGLPVLCALTAWTLSITRIGLSQTGLYQRIEDGIILVLLTLLMVATLGIEIGVVVLISANLAMLGLGGVYIAIGMQVLSWRRLALGCLLIAAEVFARFIDLFDSLLLRSVIFLVLGAAMFGIGSLFSQQKKREQTNA